MQLNVSLYEVAWWVSGFWDLICDSLADSIYSTGHTISEVFVGFHPRSLNIHNISHFNTCRSEGKLTALPMITHSCKTDTRIWDKLGSSREQLYIFWATAVTPTQQHHHPYMRNKASDDVPVTMHASRATSSLLYCGSHSTTWPGHVSSYLVTFMVPSFANTPVGVARHEFC